VSKINLNIIYELLIGPYMVMLSQMCTVRLNAFVQSWVSEISGTCDVIVAMRTHCYTKYL